MRNEDKRTWAEIDLRRLEHNYNEIRRVLPPGCRFAGLCKANAYGHGAVTVAKRLEALGADCIAVSCCEEAAELREAGLKMPILILAPSPAFLAPDIARLPAVQTIGDIDCARAMSRALAGTGLRLQCQVKLETGMGRTGFDVSSPRDMAAVRELASLPGLEVTGLFTHFAVSDEPGESFTSEQFARFMRAADELEKDTGRSLGMRHCANSGAVVNFRETCLDMVRPGLLLYGLYPGPEHGGLDLKPVMRLLTRVAEVTEHHAGDRKSVV